MVNGVPQHTSLGIGGWLIQCALVQLLFQQSYVAAAYATGSASFGRRELIPESDSRNRRQSQTAPAIGGIQQRVAALP